jgi:hypothetical protein
LQEPRHLVRKRRAPKANKKDNTVAILERAKEQLAMIEAVDAGREYDIIAIQEPWQNPHVATTYCPRGGRYHLVYAGEGSRSAIMIHKKLPFSGLDSNCNKGLVSGPNSNSSWRDNHIFYLLPDHRPGSLSME